MVGIKCIQLTGWTVVEDARLLHTISCLPTITQGERWWRMPGCYTPSLVYLPSHRVNGGEGCQAATHHLLSTYHHTGWTVVEDARLLHTISCLPTITQGERWWRMPGCYTPSLVYLPSHRVNGGGGCQAATHHLLSTYHHTGRTVVEDARLLHTISCLPTITQGERWWRMPGCYTPSLVYLPSHRVNGGGGCQAATHHLLSTYHHTGRTVVEDARLLHTISCLPTITQGERWWRMPGCYTPSLVYLPSHRENGGGGCQAATHHLLSTYHHTGWTVVEDARLLHTISCLPTITQGERWWRMPGCYTPSLVYLPSHRMNGGGGCQAATHHLLSTYHHTGWTVVEDARLLHTISCLPTITQGERWWRMPGCYTPSLVYLPSHRMNGGGGCQAATHHLLSTYHHTGWTVVEDARLLHTISCLPTITQGEWWWRMPGCYTPSLVYLPSHRMNGGGGCQAATHHLLSTYHHTGWTVVEDARLLHTISCLPTITQGERWWRMPGCYTPSLVYLPSHRVNGGGGCQAATHHLLSTYHHTGWTVVEDARLLHTISCLPTITQGERWWRMPGCYTPSLVYLPSHRVNGGGGCQAVTHHLLSTYHHTGWTVVEDARLLHTISCLPTITQGERWWRMPGCYTPSLVYLPSHRVNGGGGCQAATHHLLSTYHHTGWTVVEDARQLHTISCLPTITQGERWWRMPGCYTPSLVYLPSHRVNGGGGCQAATHRLLSTYHHTGWTLVEVARLLHTISCLPTITQGERWWRMPGCYTPSLVYLPSHRVNAGGGCQAATHHLLSTYHHTGWTVVEDARLLHTISCLPTITQGERWWRMPGCYTPSLVYLPSHRVNAGGGCQAATHHLLSTYHHTGWTLVKDARLLHTISCLPTITQGERWWRMPGCYTPSLVYLPSHRVNAGEGCQAATHHLLSTYHHTGWTLVKDARLLYTISCLPTITQGERWWRMPGCYTPSLVYLPSHRVNGGGGCQAATHHLLSTYHHTGWTLVKDARLLHTISCLPTITQGERWWRMPGCYTPSLVYLPSHRVNGGGGCQAATHHLLSTYHHTGWTLVEDARLLHTISCLPTITQGEHWWRMPGCYTPSLVYLPSHRMNAGGGCQAATHHLLSTYHHTGWTLVEDARLLHTISCLPTITQGERWWRMPGCYTPSLVYLPSHRENGGGGCQAATHHLLSTYHHTGWTVVEDARLLHTISCLPTITQGERWWRMPGCYTPSLVYLPSHRVNGGGGCQAATHHLLSTYHHTGWTLVEDARLLHTISCLPTITQGERWWRMPGWYTPSLVYLPSHRVNAGGGCQAATHHLLSTYHHTGWTVVEDARLLHTISCLPTITHGERWWRMPGCYTPSLVYLPSHRVNGGGGCQAVTHHLLSTYHHTGWTLVEDARLLHTISCLPTITQGERWWRMPGCYTPSLVYLPSHRVNAGGGCQAVTHHLLSTYHHAGWTVVEDARLLHTISCLPTITQGERWWRMPGCYTPSLVYLPSHRVNAGGGCQAATHHLLSTYHHTGWTVVEDARLLHTISCLPTITQGERWWRMPGCYTPSLVYLPSHRVNAGGGCQAATHHLLSTYHHTGWTVVEDARLLHTISCLPTITQGERWWRMPGCYTPSLVYLPSHRVNGGGGCQAATHHLLSTYHHTGWTVVEDARLLHTISCLPTITQGERWWRMPGCYTPSLVYLPSHRVNGGGGCQAATHHLLSTYHHTGWTVVEDARLLHTISCLPTITQGERWWRMPGCYTPSLVYLPSHRVNGGGGCQAVTHHLLSTYHHTGWTLVEDARLLWEEDKSGTK